MPSIFKVECRECYTYYRITIEDTDTDADEIVCCPFCGNVHPDYEIIEEDE